MPDTTRDQTIEQFAQAMFSEMGEVGDWEQTWDDLTESSQSQWLVVAERLADAGLLRGGGDTDDEWHLEVNLEAQRLTAEVAKLRAERDHWKTLRREGQAELTQVREVLREVAVDRDRAVADLAALRDQVRALADDWYRLSGWPSNVAVPRLRTLLGDGGEQS